MDLGLELGVLHIYTWVVPKLFWELFKDDIKWKNFVIGNKYCKLLTLLQKKQKQKCKLEFCKAPTDGKV